MYKVMIVEDEMLVRMGIIASVDWARFNMTIVSDVSDGQAAFDAYEKIRPYLILTDLKMPIYHVAEGFDHYEIFRNKFGDEQGHLICYSFLNIINELLGEYGNGIAFQDKGNDYVLILSFGGIQNQMDIMNRLHNILEHISRALKTYPFSVIRGI